MEELSEKKRLFCLFYHRLCDPREAAVRAGYPPERAMRIGARLLAEAGVNAELQRLSLAAPPDYGRLAAAGLCRLAFAGAGDAVKLAVSRPEERTEAFIDRLDLFAVTEIKHGKDGVLDIRLCDRASALSELAALSERFASHEDNGFLDALNRSAAVLGDTP